MAQILIRKRQHFAELTKPDQWWIPPAGAAMYLWWAVCRLR